MHFVAKSLLLGWVIQSFNITIFFCDHRSKNITLGIIVQILDNFGLESWTLIKNHAIMWSDHSSGNRAAPKMQKAPLLTFTYLVRTYWLVAASSGHFLPEGTMHKINMVCHFTL